MTIERLETIAADLYKAAEEATPIIGGADKKDWMARRLEEIIEGKESELNDFLNCETTDEVEGLLETEYQDFKDGDNLEEQADMAEADGWDVSPYDRVTPDAVIADADGIETPDDVVVDEYDVFIVQDDPAAVNDTENSPEKAPKPEKETGIKDELPDPYEKDRPAEPEFVGRNPEYFGDTPAPAANMGTGDTNPSGQSDVNGTDYAVDDDIPVLIVEEEIVIVADTNDEDSKENQPATPTDKPADDSPKGCGCS